MRVHVVPVANGVHASQEGAQEASEKAYTLWWRTEAGEWQRTKTRKPQRREERGVRRAAVWHGGVAYHVEGSAVEGGGGWRVASAR